MAIRLADLAIPLPQPPESRDIVCLLKIKYQDRLPSTNVYLRLNIWISTGYTKTTPTVGATILDSILESEIHKSLILV